MTFGRDLDDAEAWLASWSAGVSERAAQAQRMADQVASLTAAATGGDDLIEVRVGSSGTITALHLDDRLTGRPAAWLQREILVAMRRAQAALADRVAAVVAETVGADSETGRAVVDGYAQRFPAPPPDPDNSRDR